MALFLIPSPLGDERPQVLLPDELAIVHRLRVFICEKGKTGRRYLKQWETPIPLQEMTFFELNKRSQAADLPQMLQPALAGKDIGLLSEAGCPGVADPGADLIRLAHDKGITVRPLIGPSSLLLALMASGMTGQSFAFHGYLPIQAPQRRKALQQLERQRAQTQLFIETPYRNKAMLDTALESLHPDTRLATATDLTLPSEEIHSMRVRDWKKQKQLPDLHKRPTVFLLQA